MEVVLQHFSHECPLVLINEVPKEKQENLVCYGCQEPILTTSATAYSCERCNYYLHKKCGELPHGVIHPMHPQHPLTLLSRPPRTLRSRICDVCEKRDWKWFIYRCDECNFDAHISCTPLEERKGENKFHDHPVAFMRRKASFFCDACGTQGEDMSYRCTSTSCEFWIHDKCASSEKTIKRNDHHHPLQLSYSIPYAKHKFDLHCYICNKIVHPNYWVYYCASCTYFAHLKCGTSEQKQPLILSTDEYLDRGLVRVPVPGLMNMLSQFSIDTPFTDEGTRIACPNSHFWSWVDDDMGCNNKGMRNKEILCDVCVQPINFSSPFSNCGKCSFIVHARCTFLRLQIQHPSHPQHPLSLSSSWSTFQVYPCNICGGFTNGLFFRCQTCDYFLIDVGCATTCLPETIKHEVHNHPLTLQTVVSSTDYHHRYSCKACSREIDYGMKYGCDSNTTCDYQLHTNCAMLPGTLEHDWDKHSMSLTYPPFDHPEDYFCETCEEDIHPHHWLYHCSKCDHSFHTNCTHPHDKWSKVKFGITYKFEGHEHNLTFVRKPKKSRPCDHCGKRYPDYPCLDCTSCSYHLCYRCGPQRSNERIEFP